MSATPNRERGAWGMAATMDHSDIRGLGTALHLFFAGLPRSENGDHRGGCSLKIVEDSPHRSHASRFRFGVLLDSVFAGDGAPAAADRSGNGLRLERSMPSHIPDKARQFASDRHADLVLIELAPHRKGPPAFGQTQLRLPGDLPDHLGLAFLPHLETATNLSLEAIVPGRLNQHPACVFVAASGDRTLATAGA